MKNVLTLSMSQVMKGGENLYREMKAELEEKYMGQYVVFDVETKDRFINVDKYAAIEEAKAAQGPKLFYIVEIGNFIPSSRF